MSTPSLRAAARLNPAGSLILEAAFANAQQIINAQRAAVDLTATALQSGMRMMCLMNPFWPAPAPTKESQPGKVLEEQEALDQAGSELVAQVLEEGFGSKWLKQSEAVADRLFEFARQTPLAEKLFPAWFKMLMEERQPPKGRPPILSSKPMAALIFTGAFIRRFAEQTAWGEDNSSAAAQQRFGAMLANVHKIAVQELLREAKNPEQRRMALQLLTNQCEKIPAAAVYLNRAISELDGSLLAKEAPLRFASPPLILNIDKGAAVVEPNIVRVERSSFSYTSTEENRSGIIRPIRYVLGGVTSLARRAAAMVM